MECKICRRKILGYPAFLRIGIGQQDLEFGLFHLECLTKKLEEILTR